MALPGFNAETALYKTSVDYRSHAVSLPLVGVVGFRYQVCRRCSGEPRHCLYFLRQCDL